MPNYTTNYSLEKPLDTEYYNIAIFNNNFDIIDTNLKTVMDMIVNNQASTDAKIGVVNNLVTTSKVIVDAINEIVSVLTKVGDSTINGNILINNQEVNVYTHPATHDASMITESTTKRFVTDSEKAYWNNKQDALGYSPLNKTGDTMTGMLVFDNGTSDTPEIKFNDSINNTHVYMDIFQENFRAFGKYRNGTEFLYPFEYHMSTKTARTFGNIIWHAGNDGAGSGLDADMLDGKHLSDIRLIDKTGTFASNLGVSQSNSDTYVIHRVFSNIITNNLERRYANIGISFQHGVDSQYVYATYTKASYQIGTLSEVFSPEYESRGSGGGSGIVYVNRTFTVTNVLVTEPVTVRVYAKSDGTHYVYVLDVFVTGTTYIAI